MPDIFHIIVEKTSTPARPRGRPRRTEERRAQIVAAWLRHVADHGLGAASMTAASRALGLDRSTLHHYFRTHEDLVHAAMEEVIRRYRSVHERAAAEPDPRRRQKALLEAAFGAEADDPELSAVLLQFSLAAGSDPSARRQLRRAYQSFEDTAVQTVDDLFPDAPAADRRRVALAIVQLAEGASIYRELGFGEDRVDAARESALALLGSLEGHSS